MKNILTFAIAIIILNFIFPTNSISDANKYYQGKGNLILSDEVAQEFVQYIKRDLPSRKYQQPIIFWVNEEGDKAYWWTDIGKECKNTWDNEIYVRSKNNVDLYGPEPMCRGRDRLKMMADECSKFFDFDWKRECKIFAKNRTIVWLNDINKGKGNDSKINSRWDINEIYAKLSDLGFSTYTPSPKLSDKTSNDKADEDSIVNQLKALKKLYEDGSLTKDQYIKAQNIILGE